MKKLLLKRATAITLGVGMLLAAGSVSAHHSFSVEFDESRPLTLTGKITRLEWVNPHAWLFIDVKGQDGQVVNWAVQFGGANSLLRRGWRSGDLPIGTSVSITGFGSKNGRPIVAADDVELDDGRQLFAGSPGTGAPSDREN